MDKIKEKTDMTVAEDEMPLNQIQNLIYVIRGQQVMLDSDIISGRNKSIESRSKKKYKKIS